MISSSANNDPVDNPSSFDLDGAAGNKEPEFSSPSNGSSDDGVFKTTFLYISSISNLTLM